jgi:hypothetical protein
MIKPLFMLNVSSYKTYGYGLVFLINAFRNGKALHDDDFLRLVKECEMRKMKAPPPTRSQPKTRHHNATANDIMREA